MRQLKKDQLRQFINKGIILISVFGMLSCTPEMTAYFWNGHYSLQKTAEEIQKREEAFYAKETPEQQELRKRNQVICDELINKKYPAPRTIENGIYKRQSLYVECMKERGSPLP